MGKPRRSAVGHVGDDDGPGDGGESAILSVGADGRASADTRACSNDCSFMPGAFNLGLWMRTLFDVGTPRRLKRPGGGAPAGPLHNLNFHP
jgi:hypothetical protein